MDVCDECGKSISISYTCSYCKGIFCKEHAHVNNHTCISKVKGSYKKVKKIKNQNNRPISDKELSNQRNKQIFLLLIVILISIIVSWNISYSLGYDGGYAVGFETGEPLGTQIGYDLGYRKGHTEGNQSGFTEGFEMGYENGIYIGQNEGYTEGYSTARTTGFFEGNKTAYITNFSKGINDIEGHLYNLSYPSYNEAKSFLRRDKTDSTEYILGSFKCSDFAQTVKTNAAKEGIHCYYVNIDFPEPPGHAIIAFNTTDKGMVFFEPQSDEKMEVYIGVRYWKDNINRARPDYDDTIVYYGLIW